MRPYRGYITYETKFNEILPIVAETKEEAEKLVQEAFEEKNSRLIKDGFYPRKLINLRVE